MRVMEKAGEEEQELRSLPALSMSLRVSAEDGQ